MALLDPEVEVCIERNPRRVGEAHKLLARSSEHVRFAAEDAPHPSFERDSFEDALLC